MTLLISPHNDDAALFASFICLREKPLILTLLDSHIQTDRGYPGCDWNTRRLEDMAAARLLGCEIQFAGIPDNLGMEALEVQIHRALRVMMGFNPRPGQEKRAWFPLVEAEGHWHHNVIGACATIYASQGWDVRRYTTYTTQGRTTSPHQVPFEPDWPRKKLQALACYASQIRLADNVEHFLRPQHEYFVD